MTKLNKEEKIMKEWHKQVEIWKETPIEDITDEELESKLAYYWLNKMQEDWIEHKQMQLRKLYQL